MQRHVYRLIAMFLIFIGAMAFFIGRMDETVSTKETGVTEVSEASFPLVSMFAENNEINELHGYANDISKISRQEITPVKDATRLTVIVKPMENKIKQVSYELTDKTDDTMVGKGDASYLKERKDGRIDATIEFSDPLMATTDYSLKIITVNGSGRKTYFYTTLRYQQEDHLADNLKFVKEFEKAEYSGENEAAIRPYIETDTSMDNASLAHVNIHSSYDCIVFNKLKPEKVSETSISVIENNNDTSAFVFSGIVRTGKKTHRYFKVREYYRVQYTSNAMYLLSYDRTMEEYFDPDMASLVNSQLMLGVTSNKKNDLTTSPDGNLIAFVRRDELWYYSFAENTVVKVFSFIDGDYTDDRVTYDQSDIQVLGMDDSGNIDFTVYGYMNRGVYEGRNAIVLYRYFNGENRVEEQLCIPVDTPYQMLKRDINGFSYVSGESFYYFEINGTVYSYSLIKKKLNVVVEGVTDSTFIYLRKSHCVVWQEEKDYLKSERLVVMDLETRKKTYIDAAKGKKIILFGEVDSNMIYGLANPKNIMTNPDGSKVLPCSQIRISDATGKVLKKYLIKNRYVTDVKIDNSVIRLTRVMKDDNGKFVSASSDQILNNESDEDKAVKIVSRVTGTYLTQYYITLPYGAEITETPKLAEIPKMTIITTDVTAHLPEEKDNVKKVYYASVAGEISASGENAAEMIKIADDGMGFVVDSDSNTVWERGIKENTGSCNEVDVDYATAEDTSVQGAIRLFLTSKGIYLSDKELYSAKGDIMDILLAQDYISPVNLTGASLGEVLYYVARNTPVIAFTGKEKAIIITGYTSNEIAYMDGPTGNISTMPYDKAVEIFESQGNIFISSTE